MQRNFDGKAGHFCPLKVSERQFRRASWAALYFALDQKNAFSYDILNEKFYSTLRQSFTEFGKGASETFNH